MNRNTRILIAVLFSVTLSTTSSALCQDAAGPDPTIEAMERELETDRHEPLLALIADNDATLTDFSTDGCSGGLSIGWEQLSSRFPEFAARHGARPPWEECCIAHDRRYHTGGAETLSASDSFEQRRNADLELETCVVEIGVRRSPELQEIYGLSEPQVRLLYEAIAELTYRAVRLGGIPCTDQPWRWGYGWSECRTR